MAKKFIDKDGLRVLLQNVNSQLNTTKAGLNSVIETNQSVALKRVGAVESDLGTTNDNIDELDEKIRKALGGHDATLSGSSIEMIVGQAFAQPDQDSVLEGATSVVQGLDMLGRHCKSLSNRIEDINTNATGVWYSAKDGGFPNITKNTQMSDFSADMVNKLGENINNKLFFLCDGRYMSVIEKHIEGTGNMLELYIQFFSESGKKVTLAFDYYKGTGVSEVKDFVYGQSFPDASESEAGFMSAADKKTLNALSKAKLFKVEQSLPSTGETNTIYLIPVDGESGRVNLFEEYIYVDGKWELLGKFDVENDTITKVAKGSDVNGSYITASTVVELAGDNTYNVSVSVDDTLLDDVVKTIDAIADEEGNALLALTKLNGSVENISLSAFTMTEDEVNDLCAEIFG